MYPCVHCQNSYAWSHDLRRHVRNKHVVHPQSPQQKQQQSQQQQKQDFAFLHPFTSNVTGPSFSGKTYFVKTLLQNCQTKISPAPERIVWLYKRWQPLYDVIKATVVPEVEFVQGIPSDLEHDTFIDPATRNLVILDDLMSSTCKDGRINELFTEGSHHRNLSVIAINQNLYYNKDPTQRRNCHYLVMFNNPVDKQQVMTLARQMYPGNTQHLMRHFQEATAKPYGYLVVDLKPTTPDSLRLRRDVLEPIKDCMPHKVDSKQNSHSTGQRELIREGTAEEQLHKDFAAIEPQVPRQQQPEDDLEEMPSCDDCGVLFDNAHDLQRHVKMWCPENTYKRKREEDEYDEDDEDERPVKKWLSIDDTSEKDSEEQAAFHAIMKRVREHNEEEWEKKVQKYVDDGMTEKDANEKAEEKMKVKDMDKFTEDYGTIIEYILQLQHGPIHQKVMHKVKKLLEDGYDERKSIRLALRKYKYLLEDVWSQQDDDTDIDEEDDGDSDEDETTDDE